MSQSSKFFLVSLVSVLAVMLGIALYKQYLDDHRLDVCVGTMPPMSGDTKCATLVGISGDTLILDRTPFQGSGEVHVTVNGISVPASAIENRLTVIVP